MALRNRKLISYAVPVLALLVITIHFMLAKTNGLSPWKGGGFGMYSEIHYYYRDIHITNLEKPLDSIIKEDWDVKQFVMDVKRAPNDATLKRMAELVSKYAIGDTITVQLWRPSVDAETSTYTRELITEYQYIKP